MSEAQKAERGKQNEPSKANAAPPTPSKRKRKPQHRHASIMAPSRLSTQLRSFAFGTDIRIYLCTAASSVPRSVGDIGSTNHAPLPFFHILASCLYLTLSNTITTGAARFCPSLVTSFSLSTSQHIRLWLIAHYSNPSTQLSAHLLEQKAIHHACP